MDVDNLQYIAGGGTFLGIAGFAVVLILKLQSNAEDVFERRADRQSATIKDLDVMSQELRLRLDECHKERVTLVNEVINLRSRVEELEQIVKGNHNGN